MEKREQIEDEVVLRDYIGIIVKKKKLVLTVLVLSLFLSLIISYTLPKFYQVSMVIEPPVFGVSQDARIQYLDSPQNVMARAQEIAYSRKGEWGDLTFMQPKGTQIIKISLEVEENKKDHGLASLNKLSESLAEGYKVFVDNKNGYYAKQIKIINNGIISKKDEIDSQREKLELLNEREAELLEEIKQVKANTQELLAERKEALARQGSEDNLSVLIYMTTIQQNISHYNLLNDGLTELRVSKANSLAGIKRLEKESNNYKIEIEKLKLLDNSISNIKILQQPWVSSYSVRPKRRLIVASAAIAGLFLGIFLAFFLEYWQKSKDTQTA